MQITPVFTNSRSAATDAFRSFQWTGYFSRAWARLTSRTTSLEVLPEARASGPNRKYLGVQEILLGRVIGSLGRRDDFDWQFHPLKKHLRERWVNVYLLAEAWEPILVYKLGEHYYVEDGHHRLSVARALGRAYIQAVVWEYPTRPGRAECQPLVRQAAGANCAVPAR